MEQFHTAGSFNVSARVAINYTPPPTVQQLEAMSFNAFNSQPSNVSGYQVLATPPTVSNGFNAVAYVNGNPDSGGQIVIAARGTSSVDEASHDYTLLADAAYATGTLNFALQSEVQQFAAFVQSIAQAHPTAEITVTGYSLGGGIAQIVGSYAGVQTVTFDAPGSAQFMQSFQSLSNLASLNIPSPSGGNWNYRLEGDQISLIGQQVGQSITLNNPLMVVGTPYADGPEVFWDVFHSEQLLDGPIAGAPTTPGIVGTGMTLGTPDKDAVSNLIIGTVLAGASQFYADTLNKALQFDPGPGYGYKLVVAAGSPEIASLQLPVGIDLAGDNIAGWQLNYLLDGVWESAFSSLGLFDFAPGVQELDFNPVDALNDPTFYSDPFIFAMTFYSDGTFDATLTTITTPLNTSVVPEPSSLLLFGFGLVCLLLLCRQRSQASPRARNTLNADYRSL
jgi:hypothetical protein